MDSLAALRLQIEWGADEALDESPVGRLAVRAQAAAAETGTPAPPETFVLTPARAPLPVPPRLGMPLAMPLAMHMPMPMPMAMPAQQAQAVAAAAQTRAELRAALEAFTGCGLSATATNLVFDDGQADSGLMLVGEGPGAEEDRTGRPFVGASGQLLDRMLASVGLDRTKLLITNLIPWRPPGNRNPTDAEISICLPFLLRHIALVQPRYLVLLGAISTQAVLATKGGISRQRGRWIQAEIAGLDAPVATLPMLHPAYLLRNPTAKAQAWTDMVSLRRRLDSDAK